MNPIDGKYNMPWTIEDKICMLWNHEFLTLHEKKAVFFGLHLYYLGYDNELADIAIFLSCILIYRIMMGEIDQIKNPWRVV